MKKLFRLVAVIVAIFLVGCNQKTDTKNETSVNIGGIFPMTGGAAVYGKYFSDGANLAIINAIKEGRITKNEVKLIIADGKAKSADSLSAFKKLTERDNVQALMVDLSSVILAVKPQLNKHKIPSINSSSFGSDIEDADDYMFSILPNAKVYAEKIAEYSYNTLHKKKAAVVYRNDAMGLSFLNSFKNRFESLGGKVTFVETHDPGEKEYAQIVQKLKTSSDVDVVFLASYGAEAARLLKQSSEYDYKNTYITFQGFLIPKVFEVAESAAEGVYILASGFSEDDKKVAKLKKLLRDELGSDDFNYYVAAHYDAMNMIISAIEKGHTTKEKIKNYIATLKNFEGITGLMNFNHNGLVNLPLNAYLVKDGKFVKQLNK